ncbi:MAG TPA: hypothetical protein VGX91_13075 [Candidatus Cybelea sp.]|nr:hypothetical protein [Candidatus Cybelea sp.]
MSIYSRALAIALIFLAGCSGAGNATLPTSYNALSDLSVGPQVLTSADFKRIASWGSKGQEAVAQCPQHYKVIAGGSSSSNGTAVGTGFANSKFTAWIVKPQSTASAEAFATCVSPRTWKGFFRWRSAYPYTGLSSAQCRSGYTLITGYGYGTVTTSWFNESTNTYWVGGSAVAYASCAQLGSGIVIKHMWNKSQKPKTVFAGCGTGYTAIAGAMGDSAWPGPPVQQHPGDASSPGKFGYEGWWTFSNAQNELTWAACVKT